MVALIAPLLLLNPADRPNVVLFLVDDLGWADVGCNNPDTFYETPHTDAIAAAGVRFTNGYAANPVCSPTRFSVMTGRYPTRRAATDWFTGTREGRFRGAELNSEMPLDELTVAESLKTAGYRTAFLGKWHLGETAEYWPEAQGFDINIGGHSKGSPPGGYFSPYRNPRMESGPKGEYLTDRLAAEAEKLVEEFAKGDQPFFLDLSFYTVHNPQQAPKDRVEKYRKKAERLGLNPEGEYEQAEQIWPADDPNERWRGNKPRLERTTQSAPVYAAMVESMDIAIGRVLKALETHGLTENTLVLLTADNGGLSTAEGLPTSNKPLRGGKGWLYEGGIREVFLAKWPAKVEAGRVVDDAVCTIDLLPTILSACGVNRASAAPELDGVSLMPLLLNDTQSTEFDDRPLYWHYPHYSNQGGFPGGAVRQGRYKLVERYEDGQVHLYDLTADIGEANDLAEERPELVGRLRADLHRWYQDVDARFLREKNGNTPWRP